MTNNAFYFIFKSFFVPKIHFCPDIFGYAEKRLNKKDKVNSNSMTPQIGTQTITI